MLSQQELSDRLEIQDLVFHYADLIDRKCFDELRRVFTEEGVQPGEIPGVPLPVAERAGERAASGLERSHKLLPLQGTEEPVSDHPGADLTRAQIGVRPAQEEDLAPRVLLLQGPQVGGKRHRRVLLDEGEIRVGWAFG